MLDLTPDDVRRFQAIHKRETGQDLTEVQARAYALNLIQLALLVLKMKQRRSS